MIKWLKNILNASVRKIIDLEDILGYGGAQSVSGRWVNESTALKASAVFACVRLISGAVACAPCITYKGQRYENNREPNPRHPLSRILLSRPNPYVTAYTFWKAMTMDKLLHGNAYALILRNAGGHPVGVARILPGRVTPYYAWEISVRGQRLDKSAGVDKDRLFYLVTFPDGGQKYFDQSDIIHVPNLGWDGKQGVSTLRAGSEAMAGFLDAQEHGARFFKQGASFNYAVSYPNAIKAEKAKEIREYLNTKIAGVKNSYLPPILTEGAKIEPFSFNPKDSQLVESKTLGIVEICAYFGVPPVMIGMTEKTSSWGSGVEQMARWFSTYNLNDHFTAIEQELDAKVFEGEGHFAEFDESELIRGDTKTQFEAYKIARGSLQEPGILTINEIRQNLGRPPIEGGDKLYVPAENGGNPDEGPAEGTL